MNDVHIVNGHILQLLVTIILVSIQTVVSRCQTLYLPLPGERVWWTEQGKKKTRLCLVSILATVSGWSISIITLVTNF